jgi:hypothetical protein
MQRYIKDQIYIFEKPCTWGNCAVSNDRLPNLSKQEEKKKRGEKYILISVMYKLGPL